MRKKRMTKDNFYVHERWGMVLYSHMTTSREKDVCACEGESETAIDVTSR